MGHSFRVGAPICCIDIETETIVNNNNILPLDELISKFKSDLTAIVRVKK